MYSPSLFAFLSFSEKQQKRLPSLTVKNWRALSQHQRQMGTPWAREGWTKFSVCTQDTCHPGPSLNHCPGQVYLLQTRKRIPKTIQCFISLKSVWNCMFYCNNRVRVSLRTLYKKKGQWAYGCQEKPTFDGSFRLPHACFSTALGASAHHPWMPSPAGSGTPVPLVLPSASLAALLLPPQWAALLPSSHSCCPSAFLSPPHSHGVQSRGKSNPRPHGQENPVQDQHLFKRSVCIITLNRFCSPPWHWKLCVTQQHRLWLEAAISV